LQAPFAAVCAAYINKINKLKSLLIFTGIRVFMGEKTMKEGKKSAVVTGCTSGLGRSLFRKFSDEGWHVTGCGRRVDLLDSLRTECGSETVTVPCDIRLENHVSALRRAVEATIGHIDVLVLNAGAIGQLPLPGFLDTKVMELRKLYETNVFANFTVVKVLSPLFREGAVIVHITSDASRVPYEGWAGYGSSKAAFSLAMDVLNLELRGRNIMAVNLDPGDMDTEMHRLAVPDADISRLKKPDDAASEIYRSIVSLREE
jgi:NAD(P)-dependent dehydrogenase (short-subunit alcohol dehydrogenase family)